MNVSCLGLTIPGSLSRDAHACRGRGSRRKHRRNKTCMNVSCLGLTIPDSLSRDAHACRGRGSRRKHRRGRSETCMNVSCLAPCQETRMHAEEEKTGESTGEEEAKDACRLMPGSHHSRLPVKRRACMQRKKKTEKASWEKGRHNPRICCGPRICPCLVFLQWVLLLREDEQPHEPAKNAQVRGRNRQSCQAFFLLQRLNSSR